MNSGQYIEKLPIVTPSATDKVIVIQNGFAKAASMQAIVKEGNTALAEAIETKAEITYVDNEISRATNAENEINNTININKSIWDDKYAKSETFNKQEVLQKINDLINGAPGTLDTLNEIATALGNDPNFATTIINLLGNKVEKIAGKQLSTEDYTTEEKAVVENGKNIMLESTGYGVISGLMVSSQATPNMTVSIASGIVHMANGIRLAPAARTTLTINSADVTNPRKDIIYVNADSTIGYTQGISSTTPIAPSIPDNAFLLVEINVVANATSISSSNIVDKRKMKNTTDLLAASLLDIMNRGYLNSKVLTETDFNNIITNGLYKVTAATTNVPDNTTSNTYLIEVIAMNGNYVFQKAYCLFSGLSTGKIFFRSSSNGIWSDWKEISTTKVGALSLLNGWTALIGNTVISKNGNSVTFNAVLTGGATTSGTIIASLPVGFRPTSQRYICATVFNASYIASTIDVLIGTDGNIAFSGTAGGNTRLVIQLTFTI